ncbi:hypothetical protein KR222_003530, partial [Zaprionus bogoriensis]
VIMSRVSTVLFLTCICLGLASASQSAIRNMLQVETVLLNQLESYIKNAQQKHEEITRFLDYVDVVHSDVEESEDYYGNPINAFTTISRFVKNWQREVIDVLLDKDEYTNYEQKLTDKLEAEELTVPADEDLIEAVEQVLVFQDTEKVDAALLANDEIYIDPDTKKNVTASISDCFVLGRTLYDIENYEYALGWLLQARSRALHGMESFPPVNHTQILKHLAPTLLQLGNYKLAQKLNNEILKEEPKDEEALSNKIILEHNLIAERI